MRQATRADIDLDYVIQALLTTQTYDQIARRETARLDYDGMTVSRSLIAGVHRDLKAGTLRPSSANRMDEKYIKTYVWGVEPDNGGVALFIGHPQMDGDAVVISDIHAPFTDYDFAEKPNLVGEYYGVKRLIIAGDLVDGASQNNFRKKVKPPTFTTELDTARKLLAYYAEWFDEIWYIMGNHDDWFFENADGNVSVHDMYNLLRGDELQGKLILSPYDRATLNSSGELWTLPHQADVSTFSLKIGEQLAWKYQTNVIVPHQHNHAIGYDRYGRYIIADIGGLHDQNKMSYMQLKTSTRPEFDKSFAVVVDGAIELVTPDRRLISSQKFIQG